MFEPAEFIKITKILSKNLGPTMQFLLPGAILTMITATCFYQQTSSLYLSLPAIALIVIALIITVAVEVPIVKNVEQWTDAILPANWQVKRDRWLKFHVFRVLSAILSFALWIAIFI